MSYRGASLSEGQLTTTYAAIYTVPGDRSALLNTVIFSNLDASPRYVELQLYFAASGNTRYVGRIDLTEIGTQDSAQALSFDLPLSPGDILQARADLTESVDYIVAGALRTT